MPYLRTLSSFRDGIRQLAMAKGEHALKDILALCDTLRDTELVPLGVALDDQPGLYSAAFHFTETLHLNAALNCRWQSPCQARISG